MKKLRILIFGASGMVGQGALRECLLDNDIDEVKAVGRTRIGDEHSKLKQLITKDLFDLETVANELTGYDACFFCLGISAAGLSESEYAKINYELPLSVGSLLSRLNPEMVFVYVSGQGTDSTEKGPVMWARVKGKTENYLMKLPFKGAFMFRPSLIIPKNGESSKTRIYRYFYIMTKPFYSLLVKLPSKFVTTTEDISRAMLRVAKTGHGNHIVESRDIRRLLF